MTVGTCPVSPVQHHCSDGGCRVLTVLCFVLFRLKKRAKFSLVHSVQSQEVEELLGLVLLLQGEEDRIFGKKL